jgi:hypothetical protein
MGRVRRPQDMGGGDLQAPSMEVLEVEDGYDMWVPHVSGGGRFGSG